MMLWKCCTQCASKFGQVGHRTGKGVFIPIPKKGNAKECSNCHTIALISHSSNSSLYLLGTLMIHISKVFSLHCFYFFRVALLNKASGDDGIPVELFQLPKDDAWSAALNMPANLENSAVAPGLEKLFSFQSQRKAMPKNAQLPHKCTHLTC